MQEEASNTDMTELRAEAHRIAIIGAGSVGSAIAYALLLHPVAGTVLLVDLDEKLRRAQVQDLNDAAFYGSVRIKEATSREASQADIIVISAGAKQRDGETRFDLIDRNLHILKSVLDGMQPIRKDAVLLLVANPVDVLTHFAQKYSGLPQTQVLGTGTFLDTVRLKGIVAEKLGVSDRSVVAYVLGEHGDSQFVSWSTASIGGVPLADPCSPFATQLDHAAIAHATKNKAYDIIAAKGATAYGIGAACAAICKIVLFDFRQVTTVSHWVEELGCCLSVPTVLGRQGVTKTLMLPLNEQERGFLNASVKAVSGIVERSEKEN